MKPVYINTLSSHVGETVTLRGWVFNTRSSGKIRFLILRDGTGFLQCVAGQSDVTAEEFELLSGLTQETSAKQALPSVMNRYKDMANVTLAQRSHTKLTSLKSNILEIFI